MIQYVKQGVPWSEVSVPAQQAFIISCPVQIGGLGP